MERHATPMWEDLVRERGGLPLRRLGEATEAELGQARFVAAVVGDQGLLPLVARLTPAQAVALLALGELAETGRAPAGDAASRALEALDASPVETFLLKHGRVGGPAGEPGSREIAPHQVEAVLDGIAAGSIEWEQDPDFGYLVAVEVPGLAAADLDLALPRFLYRRADRVYEHAAAVPALRAQRSRALESVGGVPPEVVQALA